MAFLKSSSQAHVTYSFVLFSIVNCLFSVITVLYGFHDDDIGDWFAQWCIYMSLNNVDRSACYFLSHTVQRMLRISCTYSYFPLSSIVFCINYTFWCEWLPGWFGIKEWLYLVMHPHALMSVGQVGRSLLFHTPYPQGHILYGLLYFPTFAPPW